MNPRSRATWPLDPPSPCSLPCPQVHGAYLLAPAPAPRTPLAPPEALTLSTGPPGPPKALNPLNLHLPTLKLHQCAVQQQQQYLQPCLPLRDHLLQLSVQVPIDLQEGTALQTAPLSHHALVDLP